MDLPEVVDVLLIEDNPNDMELTIRTLKKNQLARNLHVVKDGAEALDFLFCTGDYNHREGQKPPKVILLDLKLPKVSGIDVLRRVKAQESTRSIPIVVLTSSPQERDIAECYQLGVNSYIVKPVDFSKFSQSIGEMGHYWLTLNQTSL